MLLCDAGFKALLNQDCFLDMCALQYKVVFWITGENRADLYRRDIDIATEFTVVFELMGNRV